MIDRERLKLELIDHEGKRPDPYDDATSKTLGRGDLIEGNITIGIGRNLNGRGLIEREIDFLFQNDVDLVLRDLQTFQWFDSLSDNRKRAVINMRFNLGPAGFRQFTRWMAAMGRRDYEAASNHMLESLWRRQTGRRVMDLAKMIENG
jgi:lysozyme